MNRYRMLASTCWVFMRQTYATVERPVNIEKFLAVTHDFQKQIQALSDEDLLEYVCLARSETPAEEWNRANDTLEEWEATQRHS